MSYDFGWAEHLDKRGTPCGYCGEPSTRTLVIEPDEYRNNECVRRGKRVGTCEAHYREAEEKSPALNFRRRKDKDSEQLTIDTGDVRVKRNAIYGDEPA